MQLLYLVFGTNIQNHYQANFSILTFLRQQAAGLRGVTVLTDAPAYYQRLAAASPAAVTVQPVSAATLQEWQGEFGFFWRVKIKALEQLAAQHPGVPLLYLDADTFLHGPLAAVAGPLAAGTALMHEPEGALAALRSKTERLMWQQVRGQRFGGVGLNEGHFMWNAGAVGLPAATAPAAIALALNICDDLCRAQVTPRLIEQFALSVALAETGPLAAARPAIGHYWSTKDLWGPRIAAFLLESQVQARPLAADLAALNDFDFRAVPIKQRVRSTQGRLERLVQRWFAPEDVQFA